MRILTANRLTDGAVVWLTAGGGWSEDFALAVRLAPEASDAALASALAQPTIVVGAYLVDIGEGGAVVRREVLRETIRAGGPSVGHSRAAA